MQEDRRRGIAYIASVMISGSPATAIYDYVTSRYYFFTGRVEGNGVNVYDNDRRCYISGSGTNGRTFSLYDHGVGRYVNLEVRGNEFMGYDYGTSTHFNGRVNGKSVTFYDYQTSRYYNFTM